MSVLPKKEFFVGLGGSDPVSPSVFRSAIGELYDCFEELVNSWSMPVKLLPDWVSSDPFFNTSITMLSDVEMVVYSERYLAHFTLQSDRWVNSSGSDGMFTGWSRIDEASSVAGTVITRLNSTDIAFLNTDGEISTQRWIGGGWVLVGSENTIAGFGAGWLSITQLTTSRVLVADDSKMLVLEFDGANWSQVGAEFSVVVRAYTHGVVAMSATDFVRIDINGNLEAFHFDGFVITRVGEDYLIAGLDKPVITMMRAGQFAVIDQATKAIRIVSFDGESWAEVGGEFGLGDSIGTLLVLISINATDFLLADKESGKIRTYRFGNGGGGGAYQP